jgi:hypothetical protein
LQKVVFDQSSLRSQIIYLFHFAIPNNGFFWNRNLASSHHKDFSEALFFSGLQVAIILAYSAVNCSI